MGILILVSPLSACQRSRVKKKIYAGLKLVDRVGQVIWGNTGTRQNCGYNVHLINYVALAFEFGSVCLLSPLVDLITLFDIYTAAR